MKAVVVYESIYENTRKIAETVAEGARQEVEVTIHSATEASPALIADAELLVVGGPAHMHGMTFSLSRKIAADAAAKKGDEVSVEAPGLRAWFQELPKATGVMGAAFDTRLLGSALKTGSAAKGIARRLRTHGYELAAEPESLLVEDAEGPLVKGELERAKTWGASLASGVRQSS